MTSSAIDARLPGADLVAQGIDDLAHERLTQEALLVAAAAPRLRSLGLEVAAIEIDVPLHRLYALLSAADPAGAHATYNALIGRMASFARAAEHAAAR
jgi:hypothetical protein